jgi:hypothetical protein
VRIRTGIRRAGRLDTTWQKVRDEAAAGAPNVRRRTAHHAADADDAELDDNFGFDEVPTARAGP